MRVVSYWGAQTGNRLKTNLNRNHYQKKKTCKAKEIQGLYKASLTLGMWQDNSERKLKKKVRSGQNEDTFWAHC